MIKGLEVWKLLREYLDKYTTLHLKEETHIESVEGYSLDTIEKELKALEIMTKSLGIGKEDFFYDNKTNTYYFVGGVITKEKYDLLKEVLL